jgi:hypothetical protein
MRQNNFTVVTPAAVHEVVRPKPTSLEAKADLACAQAAQQVRMGLGCGLLSNNWAS